MVEGRSGEHPCLVDDQRRTGGQLVVGEWWSVGALPLVEQLGDRVRWNAGVTLDGSGGLGGRRHREHGPFVLQQILSGGAQHAGLASPGRADHQHQRVIASHRCSGIGLQRIQTVAIDGRRWSGGVGLGGHGPREDRLLLGEHALGGVAGGGRLDPHRPAIRPTLSGVAGRVQIDQLSENVIRRPLQRCRPAVSRLVRHGTLHIADRLQHIGPGPRRPLIRHPSDDVGDEQRLRRDLVGGSVVDAGVEEVDRPAGVAGFGPPPRRQIGSTVPGLAGPCVGGCFTGHGGAFPP